LTKLLPTRTELLVGTTAVDFPYAPEESECELQTEEAGRPCVFLEVLVSADRIPNTAVLRAPGVRHLVADLPQLWEKAGAKAFVQELD